MKGSDDIIPILVTGGNGFLGKQIIENLHEQVSILGRDPESDINWDISKPSSMHIRAELVIHAAGKAHVIPKSPEESDQFFQINFEGTCNLIKNLDVSDLKQFVFISTIAVYGCETGSMINEDHPLNGSTPYALSKIKAEEFLLQWGKENDVPVLILRLPLIAGPNPPGNLGKMIKGIAGGRYISIMNGRARRSVVMADDIATVIKQNPMASGIYNLTDGYHPSFREIEQVICAQLDKSLSRSLPGWLAKVMAKTGDLIRRGPFNTEVLKKMTKDLTFDDRKARAELNWKPKHILQYFRIK